MPEDPITVVKGGNAANLIVPNLETDYKKYLKQLWGTWLSTFSYTLSEGQVPTSIPGTTKTEYGVEYQIGKNMRKEIGLAATECGESLDAWLAQFAEPLRARLAAQAAAKNAQVQDPDR